MLIGVIACFLSVFLLGIDGRFIEPYEYPRICQARAWMLSIGFTLAFGAMFSKVWRVHRLHTKTKAEQAKVSFFGKTGKKTFQVLNFEFLLPQLFMSKQKISSIQKKIQPWKLYSMVSVLLAIDIVILGVWQFVDPLQRTIELFPLEASTVGEDDARIRPEVEHCESEHNGIWLGKSFWKLNFSAHKRHKTLIDPLFPGIMYGYKGVVLVFGLFLAYETRSIKVRQINDSRYVGMSIYNVVVLCLITAPVTIVIASQQDASFGFVALAILFCCFLSMALIFVPKVIEVIRHPKDKAESKYNADIGMSKEDEEKYQKLMKENDDLQRLIAMVWTSESKFWITNWWRYWQICPLEKFLISKWKHICWQFCQCT